MFCKSVEHNPIVTGTVHVLEEFLIQSALPYAPFDVTSQVERWEKRENFVAKHSVARKITAVNMS